MKRSSAFLGVGTILITALGCSQAADSPAEESTTASAGRAALAKPSENLDQVAYSMGLNLGRTLEAQQIELELPYLFRGIEDGLGGAESMLTEQEMMAAMQAFQQEMQVRQADMAREAGARNIAEGEAFLASNTARPEVVTLPSGLQYEIVQQGDGPRPGATDRVSVHYRGTLVDGTQFDSSYDRGTPATFRLDGVIPGWSEGLQLMGVGSIWKLFLPGELAYGENPPPQGPIGPNATLIFVVELLSIEE